MRCLRPKQYVFFSVLPLAKCSWQCVLALITLQVLAHCSTKPNDCNRFFNGKNLEKQIYSVVDGTCETHRICIYILYSTTSNKESSSFVQEKCNESKCKLFSWLFFLASYFYLLFFSSHFVSVRNVAAVLCSSSNSVNTNLLEANLEKYISRENL